MAFSDFQYPGVLDRLGLREQTVPDLFPTIPASYHGPGTQEAVETGLKIALMINTEKARAEWLIAPLLADLWSRYRGKISLLSGTNFNVDATIGLTGYCDFILGRGPQRQEPTTPLVMIVESKNENTYQGLGQCIAAMVGGQRFNLQRGEPVDPIYGCCTTGTNWKFLQLSADLVTIDLKEYLISEADRILGILTHMLGPLPAAEPHAA